jgi:hypothetical protein
MKFFSNDAKENESEYDREHSDVVTSDPVAVPQQRAGSPWSDAPGSTTEDEAGPSDLDGRRDLDDGSGLDDRRDVDDRSDLDDRTQVDGTSSEVDSPSDAGNPDEVGSPDDELSEQERRDGTDETDEPDLRRDETDEPAPIDEPAARRDEVDQFGTTTYGPDGTVTPVESDDDAAIKDEGTFDSPEVVDTATVSSTEEDEDDTAKDRAEADAEVDETVDEARADEKQAEINGAPVAVDTEPVPALDTATTSSEDEDAVPVVAAVPVETAAATPGSVPAPALDRLFADGDSFAERFRDIQLRFVDSPKEATADAATLVGEAVDKLTAALNTQKESLGGDSDDTEQLRVQLRGYRDLLNRLSAL